MTFSSGPVPWRAWLEELVGDALDDYVLTGGEHGHVTVGRAQLAAGVLELRREATPLGRAAGAAALLKVDGVTRALTTAIEHLERRPDRPRARPPRPPCSMATTSSMSTEPNPE